MSDAEARRGIQLILAGAHMPDRETTKALIAVLARDHYDVVMDSVAQDAPLISDTDGVFDPHVTRVAYVAVPRHEQPDRRVFETCGLSVVAFTASFTEEAREALAGSWTVIDIPHTGERMEIPLRLVLCRQRVYTPPTPAFPHVRTLHQTTAMRFQFTNPFDYPVGFTAIVHGRWRQPKEQGP